MYLCTNLNLAELVTGAKLGLSPECVHLMCADAQVTTMYYLLKSGPTFGKAFTAMIVHKAIVEASVLQKYLLQFFSGESGQTRSEGQLVRHSYTLLCARCVALVYLASFLSIILCDRVKILPTNYWNAEEHT